MIHTFTVLHPFCGIGGAALGGERARAYFGEHEARFVNVGGIDIEPLACQDFEMLTGVRALCADMHTLTPAELRAYCPNRPDLVMSSPPCKGFSALLSALKAAEPKYQRMNQLMLDTIFLLVSTWDEPPPLLFFENVPRIQHRGKDVIDTVVKIGESHGYAVDVGNHDCGEVGGLAQHRDRCFILMRRRAICPQVVYKPSKLRVRACGEVLETMPMPGDVETGGPMHSLPKLSWKNDCRLALIPAGGDWRDLPHVVPPGKKRREVHRRAPVTKWTDPMQTVVGPGGGASESVADPRVEVVDDDGAQQWFPSAYRVKAWDQPAAAVTSGGHPSTGAAVVADPRVPEPPAPAWGGSTDVTAWDEPAPAVTGNGRVRGSGASVVADPRFGNVDRVTDWNEPVGTITGTGRAPSSGGAAVADPRWTGGGKMGVTPWEEPSATVTGEGSVTGARAAVADPRGPLHWNPNAHRNKFTVRAWDRPAQTVIGKIQPGSGGPSVADPRFADGKKKNWQQVAGVTPWTEPCPTITSGAQIHAGAFQVADPRIDEACERVAIENPLRCTPRAGAYRVIPWDRAADTITAVLGIDNGPAAVADPRHFIVTGFEDLAHLDPRKPPPFTPVIISADGTWHRPLTTLELAVLQSLPWRMKDGRPLVLAGTSHTRWREAIGNMVPPDAAERVCEQLAFALLVSSLGSFALSNGEIWVEPERQEGAVQ